MKIIEFTNEFFDPETDRRIITFKNKQYAILSYRWNFEDGLWEAKVKEMKNGNVLIEGKTDGGVKKWMK